MGAFRKGFTIIETMLFLALSGLLLVGLLGGLGGNIARQRYNDAVQDVVNMLRDQYSFVSDTQISLRLNENGKDDATCYGLTGYDKSTGPGDYFKSAAHNTPDWISYRGRTNCVIYGAVVTINEKYIETTELIGKDYQTVSRSLENGIPSNISDIKVLGEYVNANNLFVGCDSDYKNCYIRSADNSRIQYTKWGTRLLDTKGDPIKKTLLIFRSPRDGAIRTYVMNELPKVGDQEFKYDDINKEGEGKGRLLVGNGNDLDTYGINRYFKEDDKFKQDVDLDICVDAGDGQTQASVRRLVKVQRGGSGQNAVELINADVAKDKSEGASFADGEYECH